MALDSNWLDALDTPGGHILMLFLLFLVSVGLWKIGFPEWAAITGPVTGGLLGRLTGSNRQMKKEDGGTGAGGGG